MKCVLSNIERCLGIVTFIWGIGWLFIFTNNPKKSKFLSVEEKQYLADKNEAHSHPDGHKKVFPQALSKLLP